VTIFVLRNDSNAPTTESMPNQKQTEIDRILSSRINAVPTGEAFDYERALAIGALSAICAGVGIAIYGFKTDRKWLGWTGIGIAGTVIAIGSYLASGT
jgi:hypothetical protein